MHHWLLKELAKPALNHLQIWSGGFSLGGGGSWTSEATASGFEKKMGPNTTQHYTTRHNIPQHNTTQHNTAQHPATQHNTTPHNTTQHINRTQHNTKTSASCVAMGWKKGGRGILFTSVLGLC